eukprot:jgi/Picre1/28202/NNA_003608.t1
MTWIERCNSGLACQHDATQYTPFSVDGHVLVTWIPHLYGIICCVFQISAVALPLAQLHKEGIITGWRDEMYPVLTSFHAEPVLLMERSASVYFGIKAYGVHVNGYVENEDGSLDMWVARRSSSKPTWPGKLDHIVAGGQPYGISPMDNVIKECYEEAGIERELASKAVPVGAVSYCSKYSYGLKRDVLFCFDLKLPRDFQPRVNDGEVEEFYKVSVDDVLEIVLGLKGMYTKTTAI